MTSVPQVPDVLIPGYVGPWGGGIILGSLYQNPKKPNTIRLRIHTKTGDVKQSFVVSEYEDETLAWQAAEETRSYLSLALNKTKNRYRVVYDTVRSEYYLQVNTTKKRMMSVCLCCNFLTYGAWHCMKTQGLRYAANKRGGQTTLYHQLVTGAEILTHHKDGNGENNRCYNLVATTYVENNKSRAMSQHNKSGHIGVRFDDTHQIYVVETRETGMRKNNYFGKKKYGNSTRHITQRVCFVTNTIQ